MNNLIKLLFIAATTMLIAGCEPAEEVKSVEWYRQPENKAAMLAKLEQCKEVLKETEITDENMRTNCENAHTAQFLGTKGEGFQKQKEQKIPTF